MKTLTPEASKAEVPAIGQVWPGTNAIYAGKAPSLDGESIVHLILWPTKPDGYLSYKDAVEFAEQVFPDLESHIPTRMQSIVLFEQLQDQFEPEWYWTLTKTKSGKSAFIQNFNFGFQYVNGDLDNDDLVRAVSEIPL